MADDGADKNSQTRMLLRRRHTRDSEALQNSLERWNPSTTTRAMPSYRPRYPQSLMPEQNGGYISLHDDTPTRYCGL